MAARWQLPVRCGEGELAKQTSRVSRISGCILAWAIATDNVTVRKAVCEQWNTSDRLLPVGVESWRGRGEVAESGVVQQERGKA